MTSPTASLLQHLLTRSDLERLAIPSEQIAQWLSTGELAAVTELVTDAEAAEQVLSVSDRQLRADLGGRLAELGKPVVLLSPAQLQSFAELAGGDEHAADVAARLERAIAGIDGDLENIVRLALAAEVVEPEPAHPRFLDDAEVTEILRGSANPLPDSDVGAWFREDGAANQPAAPLDDLVPLAGEDLEELAATVAFHSEQIERLVDLPHVLEDLAREVAQLRATLASAGLSVAAASDVPAPEAAVSDAAPLPRSRRTALLAICVALLCWTGLVWFGTGSATLALTSFVAANVVGYLALQPDTWRR